MLNCILGCVFQRVISSLREITTIHSVLLRSYVEFCAQFCPPVKERHQQKGVSLEEHRQDHRIAGAHDSKREVDKAGVVYCEGKKG